MFLYMTFWKSSCQGLRVGEGVDFNEHKWILEGDRTVLFLNCSGGYATAYICQHSPNVNVCQQRGQFYYIHIVQ